ncbi:PLG [Mytilus edulis]|uniref:PLG n=1 Tax=Mytilus edulis TaxID=6550 RepID=A0A8S3S029_MYTED|nr:PLG [Mytilus edulis]
MITESFDTIPSRTNYALRRKASQSSTHSSRFAASKAVDGVENTFTHTKNQKNPYWSVDLGKTVSVKQINIINRKNCCGNRLKNIAVTVGVNLNKMKHCSNFKGPGKNGQVIVLTCKTPISGRYVKILRSGKGFLSLAEVQVMGHTRKKVIPSKPKGKKVKPAKPIGKKLKPAKPLIGRKVIPAKPIGTNYALRRKASQSSTHSSRFAASKAVDGVENTFTHTKNQKNPYWSVDLGKTVSVKQINIINRKNCCGNRLKNIAVTVGVNLNKMKHCSNFKGPGKNGQFIVLTCKTPISGRYVKILRGGKGFLSLAEVQVMGHTSQQCRMNLKGVNYGGNISKTRSGRTCQAWGVQTPQKHKFSKKLADQKNYCRNPDNEPHGPWCYTTDAKKRWEYCAIPYCVKKVKPAKPIGKKLKPAKPIGTNYALRRKASQSSTHSSRFAASKAVDGVENTFTHTKNQKNPYWSVDLGKTVSVKQINIINRKNCCGNRLKNIAVTVGVNLKKMKHCSNFKGPGKNGQVIVLTCKTPISGRYVKILRSGKGFLSLAEVQVMGHTRKKVIPAKPKGQQCRMNLLGANYGGNISKTRSGRTCQAWGSQTPQKHKFGKKLADQKNFCRNPDNEPYGPWCYTTDLNKRWEYCAIPYCEKKVKPAKPIGKKVKPAKPIGYNYALRRKASQSSTHNSRFPASKAVDGVENTFTHTKHQNNPYWSVDLGKTVSVKQINIINRKNCCGNRLRNIAVTVGQNLHKMEHCSNFKGPGKNGQFIVLTCKTPISGRYVKILRSGKGYLSLAEVQVIGHTGKKVKTAKPKGKRLQNIAVTVGQNLHKMKHCSNFKGPGKNGQFIVLTCKTPISGRYVKILRSGKGFLSLAEVQVIGHTGKKVKTAKPKGYNYALRRKASQSSTHNSRFPASKAVDGVENTFTHKKHQNNPYWSVDLGKTVSVKQINIINRKNCCGNRLRNIAVTVGQNLHKMEHCSNFKGPGTNYALRRKASQSSTYSSRHAASKAVDGVENTVTATKKPNNPYWSVDLGKTVKVKQINIINRKDCCGKRLQNIAVTVGVNLHKMKHCSNFKGPGKNGQFIVLTCKTPISGRYVKILRSGKGFLSLAEVQVIGHTEHNYALGRHAWQTRTHYSSGNKKYIPSWAVDGNENTFTLTVASRNPYWTVDLGKTVHVKRSMPSELNNVTEWIDDRRKWPNIMYGDIFNYLISSKAVDGAEMKNFKSLQSYNYFQSGNVDKVLHNILSDARMYLKADVRASQTVSRVNEAYVICSMDGTVEQGWCTCMAGQGLSCSHVGAVLWKVEHAVRNSMTGASCTYDNAMWNRGTKRNIEPRPLSNIVFKKPKQGENLLEEINVNAPGVRDTPMYYSSQELRTAVEQSPFYPCSN